MKNYIRILFAILTLSTLNHQLSTALAQGTAFTYQGQLQNNGSPASGTYNLTFTLFNTNSGGSAVAGPVTNSAVAVSNGLFIVTIGFGSGVWNGQTNWLQIGVESNNATAFTPLVPRQEVTPTPYAITAESAERVAGTIPASQLASFGNSDGGSGNFFIGSAGSPATSGSYNTANGVDAFVSNTSGNYNTADGYNALLSNTSGSGNTANGYLALSSNTSGYSDTANGFLALFNNTNGYENTANGAAALYGNTSGSQNTANGENALDFNKSGSGNTANGASALQFNVIGDYNTADGLDALLNNVGSDNTANGALALVSNTNGVNNTAIGYQALYSNTSGSLNTAIGINALLYNTSGDNNTANGVSALSANTSGTYNIALGYAAGDLITTGSSNIDIGNEGLSTDTNIIRIGSTQAQTFIAGVINGNGSGLTGLNAAQLTSIGNTNSQFGGNFFVGSSGNAANSGSYNTAIGGQALPVNTSGSENTASGFQALFNSNGSGNTADGAFALYSNTNGSQNIALGYAAGELVTGSSNIDIGNIGFPADTNIIRIGSGQTATYLVGNVYTPSGGVQMSCDRNLKENFAPINPQAMLDKVASLPITEWNYKIDKNAEHIGPMAQDFKAAFGLDGPDDKHISVVDEGGVALAAIQGLNQKLEEQAKEKDTEIAELKARLDTLEQIVIKQKSN